MITNKSLKKPIKSMYRELKYYNVNSISDNNPIISTLYEPLVVSDPIIIDPNTNTLGSIFSFSDSISQIMNILILLIFFIFS